MKFVLIEKKIQEYNREKNGNENNTTEYHSIKEN